MVVNFDGPSGHLVQTLQKVRTWAPKRRAPGKEPDLIDDAKTFPEFLNSTEISIIAIAVLSYRDVKLDLRCSSVSFHLI